MGKHESVERFCSWTLSRPEVLRKKLAQAQKVENMGTGCISDERELVPGRFTWTAYRGDSYPGIPCRDMIELGDGLESSVMLSRCGK